MTVWGFVSDIHGNYRALLRAGALLERHGADRIVCLGDVVGRGDPAACVTWMQTHADMIVLGNRDVDHLELLPPELQTVVLAWPRELSAADFVVSHGDARLTPRLAGADHKRGFGRALANMTELGARLWLFGHTHWPRAWRADDDGCTPIEAGCCQLAAGARYIVNVGTVGKPLAGKGPAAVATYDDTAGIVRSIVLA